MPTSSSQLGDDNIVVNHAAHLAAQAQWLLGLLRQLHDQGVALEEGKRIQIGWSMISFRLAEPHLLVVTEPDYDGNPFRDTRDDLTVTLDVQARQNDLIRRAGATAQAVSFQDKIVMAQGCFRGRHLYMNRMPNPPKGDSGWYIGLREAAGDTQIALEAIYVYQLLQLQPALLPVLLL